MTKNIFWISSYPKSGNTLLRSILVSLFFSSDGIFNFDLLKNISSLEISQRLNFIKDINEDDYNNIGDIKILSKYWNIIQKNSHLNKNNSFSFLKTHSSNNKIYGNVFLSETNTKGYIYIIRDPRDVCISWAKHSNYSIDDSINFITNNQSVLKWQNSGKLSPTNQIKPLILISSWEQHVLSWTITKWNTPRLILKYEDLIYNKEKLIIDISNFFKTKYNINIKNFDLKLKNILKTTSFNSLRSLEKKEGFSEAMPWTSFFNVGESGQWKKKLNKRQINIIQNKFMDLLVFYDYEIV